MSRGLGDVYKRQAQSRVRNALKTMRKEQENER